jgi:hypothetical protein
MKFFAILTICFLFSCASFGKLPEGSDKLIKACAAKCGTEIAIDELSCPLKGGSYKDLMDAEVQKGMAIGAAACVMECLYGVDMLTEKVCK